MDCYSQVWPCSTIRDCLNTLAALALYVGTLFGIFFLTRRYFGSTTALLAVAVYAFSELGLTAGSMLFLTYATRCFFVWMIYCVGRWVDHNDPKFLAGAILIWATGMYGVHGNGASHFGDPGRVARIPAAGGRLTRSARRCSGHRSLVPVPAI